QPSALSKRIRRARARQAQELNESQFPKPCPGGSRSYLPVVVLFCRYRLKASAPVGELDADVLQLRLSVRDLSLSHGPFHQAVIGGFWYLRARETYYAPRVSARPV
ncbi:MAG: hypothetical protein ACXVQX_13145, partial [Actinomycetota bacterium]